MAQITIDVLADLKKLQQQLTGFFKQKFQANVQGGGGSGRASSFAGEGKGIIGALKKELRDVQQAIDDASSQDEINALLKKQEGLQKELKTAQSGGQSSLAPIATLLKGIFTVLGPVAVLLKILDYFKVFDLVFAFVMTAVLNIWELLKWLGKVIWEGIKWLWNLLGNILAKVWGWIKIVAQAIWDGLKWLWGFMKPILAAVWDAVKSVALRIWDTIKWLWSLIGPVLAKVWEWIKVGWEILKEVGAKIWEGLNNVWLRITEVWTDKVQPILTKVWDVLSSIFTKIVDMVTAFFNDPVGTLKKALQFIWDILSGLPGKIWNLMKQLPSLIASAIKGAISFFGGGSGGGRTIGGGSSTSVTDALITKDGKVIRSHPSDNTIFTKNNTLGGGGGTVINLYGVTQKEMIDYVRRELGKEIHKVGRY
jgi:hypothetical protein